jgi:phage terminase large subunit-like protein
MSPYDEPEVVNGPLTDAQRQANSRAKRKGEPARFVRAPQDSEEFKDQAEQDLAFAKAQDATGTFYKSECRLMVDLYAIYYGTNLLEKEDEEETAASKKQKKVNNQPNPSKQKLTIRAILYVDKIDLGDGAVVELVKPIEPACWKGCEHTDCGREHRKDLEVDEVVSFRRWLELRDKARKDLLWLGRLLGKGLFHSVHQYVCDQFVKKNFDEAYFPGYTVDNFHEAMEKQKRFANFGTEVTEDGIFETRELLLLEQRGGYKSTIDGIDSVQWIINCPDIRIMVMTAFRQLAKKRAKEIKAYFYLPEKKTPSTFHLLFPEFITRGVSGRSDGPLECPARNVESKEDTLWVTSMESSATGDHCDILKGDDIVDPKNSADEEMRAELKYRFDSAKTDLLDPWGFVDQTGTRYFTDDMYGSRLVRNPETKRVSPLRYSCRGAVILTPEDQILYNEKKLSLREIIEERRGRPTFPYNRGWAKLRNILDEKDERNFKNQQMNEATDAADLSEYINHFTKDNLVAHSYPKESAPKVGDIWQLWDLAYSESSSSDFSVGITVLIYKRFPDGKYGVVVLDAEYGKWKSSELSTKIALMYRNYPTAKGILIEKSNGVEWLLDTIMGAAQRYGVPDLRAKIATFEIDNSRSAKRNRIKNLEILMFDERLHFVNSAKWNDECFKQFVMFTGEPSTKSRKDDFPDVVSFVFKILPRDVIKGNDEDSDKTRKDTEERHRKELLQEMHKRMFAQNYQPPPVIQEAPRQPAQDPRTAQLMKILPPGMRRRGF